MQLSPLISDLALILMVAAVVTVVFKRLHQPLVLGYIVAGFLVSPHMPYIPTVLSTSDIKTWADIGVVFLLFAMGLDFSIRRVARLGLSPFVALGVLLPCMAVLGFGVGHVFGWSHMDSTFLAAMLAVCSSTTIVYKTFTDLRVKQKAFAHLVLSVLVLEDVASIVVMVTLTAFATGSGVSGVEVLELIGKMFFFIVLWFVAGLYAVPLLLRRLRGWLSSEMLLMVSLGLCFMMVLFSTSVGFSSSFGAFVMGAILAETIDVERIMSVVTPVKDLFGAVFFVSVGMLVDIHVIAEHALPIVIIVTVVLMGQAIFGTLAFLLSGQSLKTAMQCSFSLAQVGEFPFIIASMGLSFGVIDAFIYPVIVAVSAITTFLTPHIVRAAVPSYHWLASQLPDRWQEQLERERATGQSDGRGGLWSDLLLRIFRHVVVYGILSVATLAVAKQLLLPVVEKGLSAGWAQIIVAVVALLIISPFVRAMGVTRRANALMRRVWRSRPSHRGLVVLLEGGRQFLCLVLVVIPLYWIETFPLWSKWLMGLFWLATVEFSSRLAHRGAQLEHTFRYNLAQGEKVNQKRKRPAYVRVLQEHNLHTAEITLPARTCWAGKSLAEVALRSRFGVHVASIDRGGVRTEIPPATTILCPNDVLLAIGTDDQLTVLQEAVLEEIFPLVTTHMDDPPQLHCRTIRSGGPLDGVPVEKIRLTERFRLMLVGVEREGKQLLQMESSDCLLAGDIIWLMGRKSDLNKLPI